MAVSGISTASAAADSRFGDVMFQRFELVPDPADPGGDPLAAAPASLIGISGDADGAELNAAINGAPAGFLDNVGAVDTDSSLRIAAINGTTDFVIAWTADDGAGGQEILYQIFTAGAAVDTWNFGPVAGGSGNDIIDGGVDPGEIEIWFQDEARIGQKNKITRRWAKRGTRPSAPHDQRTASTYIFGAVCPKEGKAAALVLPTCNIEAMNLHLAEIGKTIEPGAHAVLLVDQAGWHMSTQLIVPPSITIIPLPPKSPELNPMENIWQFMRDNWLSNRIFRSYEDLLDHGCEAWNKLVDQPWKIMAIGLRDWAHGG